MHLASSLENTWKQTSILGRPTSKESSKSPLITCLFLASPFTESFRYYSYGASVKPPFWSVFYQSHRIIEAVEGANDGLVSVASSKWGTYKGTLLDVNHLDLINWTNRLRWAIWQLMGNQRKFVISSLRGSDIKWLMTTRFNAIAFYLDIADMLAREGL